MKNFILIALILATFVACAGNVIDEITVEPEKDIPQPLEYPSIYTEPVEKCINTVFEAAATRRLQIGSLVREDVTPYLARALPRPAWEMVERVPRGSAYMSRNFFDEEISVNAAIQDAEILFHYIQNQYPGYDFFGGDEVFLPILQDLKYALYNYGSYITRLNFSGKLFWGLRDIISDGHFAIGPWLISSDIAYFHNNQAMYDSANGYFINRHTGETLVDANGQDINSIMKLHLNKDGEFFYSPIFLEDTPANYLEKIFTYKNGHRVTYTFAREQVYHRPITYPSLTHIAGVPVVQLMRMGEVAGRHADHATLFLDTVPKLAEEPVIVVDLRGNAGGFPGVAQSWIFLLTRQFASHNYAHITQRRPGGYTVNSNYNIMLPRPRRIVCIDSIIIFLTDRTVVSGGESFVDLAFNMHNTLVVGTATAGVMAFSGSLYENILPHTGLTFTFGSERFLWPEGHFAEYVGIQPDLWVYGDNALEYTLAMIARWGLQKGS